MADLDTRAKRGSGMFPRMPWRSPMKVISGSFSQADRQAIAFMYSGILASGGSGGGFNAAWAARSTQILGSGMFHA
jgi:hypothetical protein